MYRTGPAKVVYSLLTIFFQPPLRLQLKLVFPSNQLISWYNREKRDLPWRHTRNPYLIWLSEIILQQTRVDQGMAYYQHFAEKYPTVQVLADSEEQEILRSWQGLGYYSRARNLHSAAKSIVAEGGAFPSTYDSILKLKGVGPYTAAAIASFAFLEAVPVVDGNVNRVMSRYLALEEAVDTTAGQRAIQTALNSAIPSSNPDLFNQAIMELGALVCKAKKPLCELCPLSKSCQAKQLEIAERFPIKQAKQVVQNMWMYVILVADKKKVLLRKRDDSGIWKNMFDLPGIVCTSALGEEEIPVQLRQSWPELPKGELYIFERTRHVLSHRRFHVIALEIRASPDVCGVKEELHVIEWTDLDQYPLPRLTEKLLEKWRADKG